MTDSTIKKALIADVVIEGSGSTSGAQTVAPETAGRGGQTTGLSQYVPTGLVNDPHLQRQVESFLFVQAAKLDAKDWQGFINCFAETGIYWMPSNLQQTDWESEPSIFAEDTLLMEIRMGRMLHPNAWSQAPMWATNHLLGNIIIEKATDKEIQVASRFQMMELRRDDVRHFAGTYRHTLLRVGDQFQISLQRVDMMNGQAAYDYVLQAWV